MANWFPSPNLQYIIGHCLCCGASPARTEYYAGSIPPKPVPYHDTEAGIHVIFLMPLDSGSEAGMEH
jgi:hypothetical protein